MPAMAVHRSRKTPRRIWPSLPAVSTALGSLRTGPYRNDGGIPATNVARYRRPATSAVLRKEVTAMSSWLGPVSAARRFLGRPFGRHAIRVVSKCLVNVSQRDLGVGVGDVDHG